MVWFASLRNAETLARRAVDVSGRGLAGWYERRRAVFATQQVCA